MKNAIITCRVNPKYGKLDFYAECSGESYYVFTQKYSSTLFDYFRKGVSIYKLFDFSRTHGNKTVIHTILRLKNALRYLEKYEGLQVLRRKHDSSVSYRKRKEYDLDIAA